MAPDSKTDSPQMSEWNAAREILNDVDERLHDLRKYGFTFITALLTTESILFLLQRVQSLP